MLNIINFKTANMKIITLISVIIFLNSCTTEDKSSNANKTQEVKSVIDTNENADVISKGDVKSITTQNDKTIVTYSENWSKMLKVFIYDPDTLPTNVRDNPSGDVILKLPKSDEYEVWLNNEIDGWFKVESVEGINGDTYFENVNGFIHGSILGVDTRNYGGEKINIYYESDANSQIKYSLFSESRLTLVSADQNGNWIKVRYNDKGTIIEGWIEQNWLCGSLRTNCS